VLDELELLPHRDPAMFLGTVGRDGVPHSAGIGAAWVGGGLFFTSSPAARKARDVAANPACTISIRLPTVDVVFQGLAERVRDAAALERVAKRYRDGGWPAEVEGDALTAPFNAPSAGPPPYQVYRLRFDTVFGVATAEPYGATRWTFGAAAGAGA
jgi:hypothetical protein